MFSVCKILNKKKREKKLIIRDELINLRFQNAWTPQKIRDGGWGGEINLLQYVAQENTDLVCRRQKYYIGGECIVC